MKRTTERALIFAAGWVITITLLHLALNFDWATYRNEQLPEGERKLNVAYIPVT